MTYRIGWLSPLTPASGVGTFSHAVARQFPKSFEGEQIDLTMLHLGHRKLYQSRHRSIQIDDSDNFHQILTLFDLLIYNIGNNREHHELIFDLLRIHPGIIICHDYVYQHYLAERSVRSGRSFISYAALLLKHGDRGAEEYLKRSRITSRSGQIRYSPWDSDYSVMQPMSEAILDLGSALVVHSRFAERHVAKSFKGPILRLGMPHDQKARDGSEDESEFWSRLVTIKRSFHIVTFGHIQATKCIDLVLSAVAASKMLRRQLRYTIAGFVGDESYFNYLQAMVSTLALRDVVTFELNVSDARLADLMGEADIFVNLRKPNTEGSSASLIEQLDVGKPVVVLDSGCYAEISAGAAVKLPVDATSLDIQNALEKLIGRPEQIPVIGRAGREYARSWTCASYAESLVRFAYENRELLEERAREVGIRPSSRRDSAQVEGEWTRNLARARASLRYLDRNMLALDPDLVMSKSPEELCAYVAHILFGIFNDGSLLRALARFFAGRDSRAAYWACVRFGVIADAVFGEDEGARHRLKIMNPVYEPEFWDVIEHFPAAQYFATATLLFESRLPEDGEFASSEIDDSDGFPKRLRLAEFVRALAPDTAGHLTQLKAWLEQPTEPSISRELPIIEGDFACMAGSAAFRAHTELSGFYALEPDHVWARGLRGFIGVRLGSRVSRVELLVNHIDASPDRPCIIGVTSGAVTQTVEVRSGDPEWICLDLPRSNAHPSGPAWLQLWTNRAARPSGSCDPRILGACLRHLRVTEANGEATQRQLREAAAVP